MTTLQHLMSTMGLMSKQLLFNSVIDEQLNPPRLSAPTDSKNMLTYYLYFRGSSDVDGRPMVRHQFDQETIDHILSKVGGLSAALSSIATVAIVL